MITGYNTDVHHRDTVFHVQTEDRGASNPYIESLVYVGGQVVASRRSSYADLLAAGKGERAIVGLMEQQHRGMIEAIREGRFDEKLAALLESTGVRNRVEGADGTSSSMARKLAPPAREGILEEGSKTLDQVILDYLSHEADQDQLLLVLDGHKDLALGRKAALMLRASSSKSGRPVGGAQVQIKMISTATEPRTLATGETRGDGTLKLAFDVPSVDRGTAALIITASSPIGSAEIKQLL